MSRLQWGLGLVAIAAAACGGLPPPRPTSSAGAGNGSAIALDSVTSLTEVTSDGEQRPVTRDGVIEVDINSKIRVDVDRDRVAQLFYERAGIDRAQVAALDQRLRELDALTLQQKQNLLQLQALERQLDTVGAAQLAAAPETEGLLNALGRSEGELARNVGDYAKRYRLDAGAFFAGDTSALLDAERQSTLEQAKVLQQRAAELRWRMQAVIASGDKTSPVHLDNYDSYPESVFSMVEKLVPQTTPAELASQLETAKQLAKDTKDLAGLRDAIVKAISTKLSEFVESLRRAVLDDIDAFDKLATAIANDARAIAEVKKLRDDVVALGGPLRTIRTGCSAVVEIVRQGALGHGAVAAAQVCFNELKSQLPVVRPRVEELLRDVGAVEQWAAKNRATLRAAVTRVEDALRQAKAAELLRTFIADGEAKWNALATFLGLAAAQTKAPVWSEDQQTDHPLREITSTAIELTRTVRHEGDSVHFRASLMSGDSPVLVGPATTFRIIRMGTYIDVSASVLFMDKKDDHWGPFNAAPAVVAAIHHRWRNDSTGAGILNALRPGAGLHFAYPRLQSDSSFELGVGGSLLLFGDLLQVGAGYDIQANASYWYLGFGLDTLAKLGVRFSVGGS